jgi:hypothetical protein
MTNASEDFVGCDRGLDSIQEALGISGEGTISAARYPSLHEAIEENTPFTGRQNFFEN